MGHWGIDDNDESEDMWGDEESDILDDYIEYLLITDPKRLMNREQMIADTKVLIWEVYYEHEIGRTVNRRELEYGVQFCFMQADDYLAHYVEQKGSLPELHVPEETPWITYAEVQSEIGLDPETGRITSYLNYLKEMEPQRLSDRERLVEDTRLLTYHVFHDFKGRPAFREELDFILNASIDHA